MCLPQSNFLLFLKPPSSLEPYDERCQHPKVFSLQSHWRCTHRCTAASMQWFTVLVSVSTPSVAPPGKLTNHSDTCVARIIFTRESMVFKIFGNAPAGSYLFWREAQKWKTAHCSTTLMRWSSLSRPPVWVTMNMNRLEEFLSTVPCNFCAHLTNKMILLIIKSDLTFS